MSLQTRSIIWIDNNGWTQQTIVGSDPSASSIQTALQGHSNADVLNWWESAPNPNSSPSTVAAVYQTVMDTARLLFVDSGGSLVTLNIPAPMLNIFAADSVTVDPSTIVDLTTAFIAEGRSASGLSIASFVGGNLFRRKAFA